MSVPTLCPTWQVAQLALTVERVNGFNRALSESAGKEGFINQSMSIVDTFVL